MKKKETEGRVVHQATSHAKQPILRPAAATPPPARAVRRVRAGMYGGPVGWWWLWGKKEDMKQRVGRWALGGRERSAQFWKPCGGPCLLPALWPQCATNAAKPYIPTRYQHHVVLPRSLYVAHHTGTRSRRARFLHGSKKQASPPPPYPLAH